MKPSMVHFLDIKFLKLIKTGTTMPNKKPWSSPKIQELNTRATLTGSDPVIEANNGAMVGLGSP